MTALSRGWQAFWFCTFLAWIALPAAAQTGQVLIPPPASRVIDLGGALDASTVETLLQDIEVLERDTQAQVGVLIVPTTGEETIEQLATRVFARWQLGRAGANDGVLLLVALQDRRMRIEVGQGLEGTVTDIDAARIIDEQMAPRFRNEDHAGGLQAAVAGIGALIRGETLPQPYRAPDNAILQGPWAAWSLLVALVWGAGAGAGAAIGWQGRGQRPVPARRSAPATVGLVMLFLALPLCGALFFNRIAAGWVLLIPGLVGAGLGYASVRNRTARRLIGVMLLFIVALVALGHWLGADRFLEVLAWAGAIGATVVVAVFIAGNIRAAWRLKNGRVGFAVRCAVVLAAAVAAPIVLDAPPEELGLITALTTLIALLIAFLPASAGGSGRSSSGYGSSGSGGSSSASSGGSSSGGGASGSW